MNTKNTLDSKGYLVPLKGVAPWMAILMCASLGCTGSQVALRSDESPRPHVSLRADGSPGPERCSDEALKTMRILRLQPETGAFIEIDPDEIGESPVTLTDGPIESLLDEDLTTLPAGTRLYGQLWTGGPELVIRYYEAQPPGGERVPICGVARWGPDGAPKLPGSGPGVVVLKHSRASMWIVRKFR